MEMPVVSTELLESLCEAASRNDATAIAKALNYRPIHSQSTSYDEPLVLTAVTADTDTDDSTESPSTLISLLQLITKENQPQNFQQLSSRIRPELVLRALLLIPSAYEAPWRAMCAVQHCTACICDVQTFLQQAASAWCQEERRLTTATFIKKGNSAKIRQGETLSRKRPRDWMLTLMETLMEPLLLLQLEESESTGSNNNDEKSSNTTRMTIINNNNDWIQSLELISTLIVLCNDLADDLLDECLHRAFRRTHDQNHRTISIRSDCLLPWVHLASDSRLILKAQDVECIQKVVREALESKPINSQDLPGLAEALLSMATTRMDNQHNINTTANNKHFAVIMKYREELCAWQKLILLVLNVASQSDLEVLSTVETLLESKLALLRSAALHLWATNIVESIKSSTMIPKPTQCNMLLLVLRASRLSGSQMVSELIAQALGSGGARREMDIECLCWDGLCDLVFSTDQSMTRQEHKSDHRPMAMEEATVVLEGLSYQGSGCFFDKEGNRIDSF
jgi:hypothetical protein